MRARFTGWLGKAARGLRLAAAGLVAGLVAGAVAGLGARVVMYAIRLMNSSYNGVITHAGHPVGQITLSGTAALLGEGMFVGLNGGVIYLVVRRWIPGRGVRKGVAFGVFLMMATAPVLLDGGYEFFRYVPAWISVLLFALLYPLYGAVVAPLTERLGRGTQGPPRNRVVARVGYVVMGAAVVWFARQDIVLLRDVFHLFG